MALGIDLGTTNSSVAATDDAGTVYSLSVRSGREPFDAVIGSVVFDPLGAAPTIGRASLLAAERSRSDAPLLHSFKPRLEKQRLRRTITRIETVMDRGYDFVNQGNRTREVLRRRDLYDRFSREEVVAAAGHLLHRLLTAEEVDRDPTAIAPRAATEGRGVLTRFLRRTRQAPTTTADGDTWSYSADTDDTLYVGVPATFATTGRRRILAALAESGCFGAKPDCYRSVLSRCRLVFEPLAIASTLAIYEPETILIVDYGGGTLDLALLDVDVDDRGVAFHERSLYGMGSAGDGLDDAFILGALSEDPALKRGYQAYVHQAGEMFARQWFVDAKIRLSSSSDARLPIPGAEREITRAEFERHISRHLNAARESMLECLARGGSSPAEVDRIVLTGGSSLIPRFQDVVRSAFPHLDDDHFSAEHAGDPASERRALTGVSRGLARFGFLECFEATVPCTYSIQFAGHPEPIPCLERGAPDVTDTAQASPVRISLHGTRPTSAALFGDLIHRSFAGAISEVSPSAGGVDVRVASSRQRFAPAFAVYEPGEPQPLAAFDLENLPPDDIQTYVEDDRDSLPCGREPATFFLTRRLKVGDYIEWSQPEGQRSGQVHGIREVSTTASLDEMTDWDPRGYAIDVHPEIDDEVHVSRSARPDLTPWNVRIR